MRYVTALVIYYNPRNTHTCLSMEERTPEKYNSDGGVRMKISREKMLALGDALRHPDFKAAGRRVGEMVTGGWYNKGDEQSGDGGWSLFLMTSIR